MRRIIIAILASLAVIGIVGAITMLILKDGTMAFNIALVTYIPIAILAVVLES